MQNRRLYQEEGALFSWDCWAVHNLVSVWRRSACAFFTNVSTIAVIISRNHIFHVKRSLPYLQQFHIHQKSEPWSNNKLFIYIITLRSNISLLKFFQPSSWKLYFQKWPYRNLYSPKGSMYRKLACILDMSEVWSLLECNRCFLECWLINTPLSSRLSSSSLQVN